MLKIVSIGTTPLTEKINSLIQHTDAIELVGVVNLNPVTHGHRSNFAPMDNYQGEILYVEDINASSTVEWVERKRPDVIIQSGWSQIWHSDILNIPKLFSIGIHAAPLPIGRGAAIINWKIIEGGGKWGSSLFIMESKTDTGDILDQEPFVIEELDNVRTAYLKADNAALVMLKKNFA